MEVMCPNKMKIELVRQRKNRGRWTESKLNGLLWHCGTWFYSRTSDLQDDPGLQRGFKSIYARFNENYLKENGENT